MLHRAVFNVLVRDAQRIGKARAGGREVEGGAVVDAQHLLDHAGRAGKSVAGRRGSDDNQSDVACLYARHLQRALRGREAHAGHGFIRRGNAALADAGAGHDPLVRRLHHFFQIRIRTHLARQIAARTDNFGKHLGFITPG